MIALALLSAAIWAYLILVRGGFWRADDRDEPMVALAPSTWPSVVAVIPARNEADVIGRVVTSLLAQDYAGRFRIVIVDDNSDDATAQEALAAAANACQSDRLSIVRGAPLPGGWTGKLWALHQGLEAADETAPIYYWLTDADITYQPETLRTMVARATQNNLVAVSLMAHLRCVSFAEKLLIPAFIFFFQMLYPFRWVNQSDSRTAAAAGGCVLVKRDVLAELGGIAAIRGALIDDCTLAALLKGKGRRIWLGLTHRADSIRVYDRFEDIRRMVARSAYAQLHYSPAILLATLVGMAIVYVVPPALALFGSRPANYIALATWISMALVFIPTLQYYGRSKLWALFLPMIAFLYMAFTLDSAWQYAAGRGGQWKGRVQASRDM